MPPESFFAALIAKYMLYYQPRSHAEDLTNHWSQPLAVVKSTFQFYETVLEVAKIRPRQRWLSLISLDHGDIAPTYLAACSPGHLAPLGPDAQTLSPFFACLRHGWHCCAGAGTEFLDSRRQAR